MNATPAQVAAATTILERLVFLVPSGIETNAHADMASIIAEPDSWDVHATNWALESAVESTAEWTRNGYEDAPSAAALAAIVR